MDRRTMLKELALGSGLLIMPQCFSLFGNNKRIQIIVIGDLSSLFMKELYEKRSGINYTYIGWQSDNPFTNSTRQNSFVELDLTNLYNDDCTPDNIFYKFVIDAMLPRNNYVFVTNLIKPQTLLSKSILNWAKNQKIDFRFFGTTPMFNYNLAKIARFSLKEFDDDFRVKIFDIDGYLKKIGGSVQFSVAMETLDNSLADKLYELCLSF